MAVELAQRLPPARSIRLLRSVRSEQESFVVFVNISERNVNLYWMNYKGERTYYLTLSPLSTVQINTFCSHPWIFLDQQTGDHMQVGHQNVFWPQPYRIADPNDRSRLIPCRKEIFIHFPLRTLRENCLWRVVGVLHAAMTNQMAVKIVDMLSLPHTLKADLKDRMQRVEANRELGR